MGLLLAAQLRGQAKNNPIITAENYLRSIIYTPGEIRAWLAGEAFPFARYSSEFGWLLPDAYFRDGVDNSVSQYRYEKDDGPRIRVNYAGKPCRINTYGDSFTQCHQVSDGETWQEVLAAHLHEPVRNFGIGGWSVYQAYRRMLKEEERTPSDVIIFNIYHDDHSRNLDAWRNIRVNISYSAGRIAQIREDDPRWDKAFVDFLKKRTHPVIDMAEEHIRDHAENYKMDFNDYLKQFFVGHYNPRGNFFCAFATKDALVKLLDPKPMAYSDNPEIMR